MNNQSESGQQPEGLNPESSSRQRDQAALGEELLYAMHLEREVTRAIATILDESERALEERKAPDWLVSAAKGVVFNG